MLKNPLPKNKPHTLVCGKTKEFFENPKYKRRIKRMIKRFPELAKSFDEFLKSLNFNTQ